ncbi:MBL fold metallo-hydrolase [Oceanobacillus massiliensis]|uniref:MBL fold metallo-hydrolase n=1 Tax=Oceanobacillus massiliensis TaxID=1465765 RepID=UPI00301A088A
MNTRFLLTMFLTIFLVACGQDSPETLGENSTGNHKEVTVEEREKTALNIESEESDPAAESVAEEDQAEEKATKTGDSPPDQSLSDLKAHYIDVGQADAALFEYNDGNQPYTILFDTGDWQGNEVVTYLKSQDVSDIDLVVVSHPDADHIGQLDDVMQTFEVGEVWLSGNESSSDVFQRGMEAVINSGADFHEPRTGEEFEIGPLEIDVLHPDNISGKSNEESVSLLFTYGSTKFLFTGDADRSAELEMMESGMDIKADIIQLGHHGSDTSSDPAFISAVHPSVAIYSAGAGNSYGHPGERVVSLIKKSGIELYGTDVNGTIVVTTDGENYHIATNKDGTVSPGNTGDSQSTGEKADENLPAETEPAPPKDAPANNSCININSASVEAVQGIIHIGPARAQDLIDLRPFNSVDDLSRISGIGPARIAEIKSEGLACT